MSSENAGLYYIDFAVILEWIIIVNSLNIEFIILIDWISLLFIRLIMLISSIIILYRYVYIFNEINIYQFVILVNLFILSIILMVLRPNIISILFGWDGLGLVSYYLVIFYQNYNFFNLGMFTVLCNRIGDVGLLLSIGLLVYNGRWNLILRHRCRKMVIILLIIAAITKSAQIPFSMWLPMAIAAPTLVSALVHSSTLVTAGVYLIIRFRKFLLFNNINIVLYFLSVVTIFIAGAIANVEFDLKKIIALSTLSQLGLIIITLKVGLRMISFYNNNLGENNLINISIIILIILRISLESMIRWVFFFYINLVYLSFRIKILTINSCLLGLVIGGIYIRFNVMKLYYFRYFLGSIWFLNNSYISLYKIVNFLGVEVYIFDKTWLEFSVKNIIFRLIKWIKRDIYKIYMFVIFFIYLIIILVILF